MSEPTPEALPGSPELFPSLRRQIDALVLVSLKHIVQFFSGAFVDDHRILLIVKAHAASIQVGRAYCTELPIHHHNL